MSGTIRCIYHGTAPSFPATAQHPDAVRYTVGQYIVDAVGGEPTEQEVDAVLNPPAPTADELEADCAAYLNGGANRIDLRKLMKAHIISCEAYRLNKSPAAMTGAELAAIRNRIANIYKAI